MVRKNRNRAVLEPRNDFGYRVWDNPSDQEIAGVAIEERPQNAKKFSVLNLINPFWMVSSLARALFRLIGFRKRSSLTPQRPREYDSMNALSDDYIVFKYPLSYSLQSIVPDFDEDEINSDTKCTQTEWDDFVSSKIDSQLEQLIKLQRFRNAIRPSRKKVRRMLANDSSKWYKAMAKRNRSRYGGNISKDRRTRKDKMLRGLRSIKSKTSSVNVHNAMEDVFYISDSDN